MLSLIFAKQDNGGPGDPARNADLGFVQKCGVIPLGHLLGQRRMFLGKIFPCKSDSLRIEVIYRCPVADSGGPVLDRLPSNILNFLKVQRAERIMDAPVSNPLPCRWNSSSSRGYLEQNNAPVVDNQLMDIDECGLMIAVF